MINFRLTITAFFCFINLFIVAQQKEKAPKIVYKTEIKPLLAMNKIEEAVPLLNKYFKQNLIIGEIWNPKVMLLESSNMFEAEKTLAYHYDDKAFKEHSIIIADSAIFWFNRMLTDHHSDSTYAKNRIIFLNKSKNEFASIAHEKELTMALQASNRQKMIADSLDNIRIEKEKREKFVKDSIETVKIKNDELLKNKNAASTPLKTSDNVVNTVKIGQQVWMTADLKSTTYINGTPIPEAKSDEQWKKYNDNHEGCFRRLENNTILYNGFAVFAITDNGGIIPPGYKIPSFNDFEKLYNFLGKGESQSGLATKALATYPIKIEKWVGNEENGSLKTFEVKTNGNSGFKATQGGFIYNSGAIGGEGSCSFWWTSTFDENESGYVIFDIGHCSEDAGGGRGIYSAEYGFALRLIQIQELNKQGLNGTYLNKAGQKLIISNSQECCFDFDVTWGVNDKWGCIFNNNGNARFKSSEEAYSGDDPEWPNINFTFDGQKIKLYAGYNFIGDDCSKFGNSNSDFYTEFVKKQ